MSLTLLGRLDRLTHIIPEVHELRITGFQSPAEDEKEETLSLDKLTDLAAAHSWPMQVADDSLHGFGLYRGDQLVVHRGCPPVIEQHDPKNRARLVIVDLGDGEGYRMRLMMRNEHDRLILRAANRSIPDLDLECDEDVDVFGVVKFRLERLG